MISCKQCGSHNGLDSTFCRKCGTVIGEIEIQEGRAKLDILTAEGNAAFTEGRTDEALAVAESVLFSDPDSVPALWLKAICHERRDEIAEALDCADRIVELNPDSELDKIRRNQLRSKLSTQLQVYERPDRRVALAGAVAAVVLVLCIGVLAANTAKGRTSSETVAVNTVPNRVQQPLGPSETNPTSGSQVQQGGTQQLVQPGNQGANGGGALQPGDVPPIRANTSPDPERPTVRLPNLAGPELPNVNGGVRPFDIGTIKSEPPSNPPQKAQNDDPVVIPPGSGEEAKPENDGSIEIKVYGGGNNAKSAGAEANGAKAQSMIAKEQFLMGNYRKAASLFEQAIRSGGDPISLNQKLGQSYEKMGQSGDAVQAYRRAVQAADAALGSGRGNPDQIRSAKESAEQALRNLGG